MTGDNSKLFLYPHVLPSGAGESCCLLQAEKKSFGMLVLSSFTGNRCSSEKSGKRKKPPILGMIYLFQNLAFLLGMQRKKANIFETVFKKVMDSGAQVCVLTGLSGSLGPWRFRVKGWAARIHTTSPRRQGTNQSSFKTHLFAILHVIFTIPSQISY